MFHVARCRFYPGSVLVQLFTHAGTVVLGPPSTKPSFPFAAMRPTKRAFFRFL
jgi:hypothetical protein